MKTVIDAVNEFKGEWPNIIMTESRDKGDVIGFCKSNHTVFEVNEFHWVAEGFDISVFYWVCNNVEFNDLVSQMETNFGQNQLYSYYKLNFKGITTDRLMPVKSDKELEAMDIEDKFEFCDNSGTHTITSNNILCCAGTGRVVAVFYNERDLREATGLTKKLELIDGKAYQFEARGSVFHGIYEKRAVSFNVMTGQFFNTISCTNIQPLTVEVK